MSLANVLWDIRQQKQIDGLKRGQLDDSVDASIRARQLELRLGRLELLVHALAELLVERARATPEELAALVAQIDLRDGVEDGVMDPTGTKPGPRCLECGRPANPRRPVCVYCGAGREVEPQQPKEREVACPACKRSVPLSQTVYTAEGLRCGACGG